MSPTDLLPIHTSWLRRPVRPPVALWVAQAIDATTEVCGGHLCMFSENQCSNRAVGTALVQQPAVKAVSFTGSLGRGRALFDLCATRPEPIAFFGEPGSVNSIFILNNALKARGRGMGAGWAALLTMGPGQFCTNPGITEAWAGPRADAPSDAVSAALEQSGPQTMLTGCIASTYFAGRDPVAATSDQRSATPYLLATTTAERLANETLGEEVFGPLGMIVVAKDGTEILAFAKSIQGQLTCSIHMEEADSEAARTLLSVLERKAARLLANSFPTGIEVCDAMVHGGPCPASTNFGATLGLYHGHQAVPEARLLPKPARSALARKYVRIVGGASFRLSCVPLGLAFVRIARWFEWAHSGHPPDDWQSWVY